MRDFDDIDIELARLGRATEDITSRADFSNRVLQAIQAEAEQARWLSLKRAAGRLLPVAAFAAMVAMAWAVEGSFLLEEILASYDATEIDW